MKQKYAQVLLLFFTLIFPSVVHLPQNSTIVATLNGTKDWTVMLYFCADTRNTEVVGIDNSGNSVDLQLGSVLNYLKNDLATGSQTQLNVLVLYDYPYSPSNPSGHAVLYHITPGVQTTLAQWGATNMGDEGTLSQFINYCKANFPANNYALFLSDHGRGYAGICYDYHAPHPYNAYALGDCLELPEIRGALSGGNEVDVLFLDCCLGSSFELAWEVAFVADYMMASETVGPTKTVYQPRDVLYALSRDTSMTPRNVAEAGYEAAVNPVLVPSGFDHWPSAVSARSCSSWDSTFSKRCCTSTWTSKSHPRNVVLHQPTHIQPQPKPMFQVSRARSIAKSIWSIARRYWSTGAIPIWRAYWAKNSCGARSASTLASAP